MNDMALLVDLHKGALRQGPGGDAQTEQALQLAGVDRDQPLHIADIGCGTGASSLVLARLLNAHITAVDFLQDFLDVLQARARAQGLDDRIQSQCRTMDDLPFEEASLDVIWSEGAIYNIGFERGVREWARFLKPGGLLVVSEISWLTAAPPDELRGHWEKVYPEIDSPSAKLGLLERNGYAPQGYFALPDSCWLDNYYSPMEAGFGAFLERNGNSEAAQAIVAAERREIALYRRYRTHLGYGMYIARKCHPG
ncbi:class I SAM-dependent methyltransferase [Parahaliea aestuarii]|uniref:Class I SAM-dependent methyltransferase n=1 Tax=Parahaliea aestuarii TaxID=1852021 RepID=A0A5C8ZW57_9GAMM|nr:class I SAM-dependent methyltransferase [Parahaliea aestuarii]TXS91491.1 class I SAM-dependent methyltransferase [Parahaliea aestuarii]